MVKWVTNWPDVAPVPVPLVERRVVLGIYAALGAIVAIITDRIRAAPAVATSGGERS